MNIKTSDQNKFGLTERDMQTIKHIFSKYGEIKKVNLFGSRAKGSFKMGSDVDLAIMNLGVSEKTIAKLKSDFEESSLPYMIDCIDFSTLTNNDFIDHINRVGILFYEK